MATPTNEWTKVLVHPLGLTGYVLFLLFGLLARTKRRDEKRWLFPAALAAAGIALVGGLGLAYLEIDRTAHETQIMLPVPTPAPTPRQSNDHVKQIGVTNVQGVQGDVTITIGQSPSKTPKAQINKSAGTATGGHK
jgi:hypothetical protein